MRSCSRRVRRGERPTRQRRSPSADARSSRRSPLRSARASGADLGLPALVPPAPAIGPAERLARKVVGRPAPQFAVCAVGEPREVRIAGIAAPDHCAPRGVAARPPRARARRRAATAVSHRRGRPPPVPSATSRTARLLLYPSARCHPGRPPGAAAWKWALNGQRSPWRSRIPFASGPTQSSSSRSSSRIQSSRPRCPTTSSCHSASDERVASGKTFVTGTGSGSPSRRATEAAAASTAEESRPPEKLTKQGPRVRAGRRASRVRSSGSSGTCSGAGAGRGRSAEDETGSELERAQLERASGRTSRGAYPRGEERSRPRRYASAWSVNSSAYSPSLAISDSWSPCSTIRPASST